jgi:hypothetical protein
MVKRKEVTDYLRAAGLHPTGGTEHWTDGVHWTQVPRHKEISNQLFEKIKKQAGQVTLAKRCD